MNYILALVGPSGSGKTSIILEAIKQMPDKIQILESTTTRARRDSSDDGFYNFISFTKFDEMAKNAEFINYQEYAGNHYGSQRSHFDEVLNKGHGIMAVVESAIGKLKAYHPVKVIKINPVNQKIFRGQARKTADLARSQIHIDFDFEIDNSFEPGGLARAVKELTGYVKSL